MRKKLIGILVCLSALVLMFTGCGRSDSKEESAKDTTDKTEHSSTESPLKIGVMTGPSGVADGGFNQNIYQGIGKFIQTNPEVLVTNIVSETDRAEDSIKKVNEVASDFNVLICCGYQYKEIGKAAKEHPKVKFILVDAYPTNPEGVEETYDNVYAMKFAEQESGFCAGMAAALESATAKVAVVNGMPYPSNLNYQNGFYAGVDYANKHYQMKAELVELPDYAGKDSAQQNIGGNYIGDFTNTEKAKEVGIALLKKDVDVIFVAAGSAGQGVYTAVKEAVDKPNVKIIGSDMDQYDTGIMQDRNIVLTSVLKHTDVNVTKQLNQIMAGKFKGENVLLKADTYSTGYVRAQERQQLSDDTIKKIDEAFELVKNKTIEISSS